MVLEIEVKAMKELNLKTKMKISHRIIEVILYLILIFVSIYFLTDSGIGKSMFISAFTVFFMMFVLNPILNKWEDWLDKRSKLKNK